MERELVRGQRGHVLHLLSGQERGGILRVVEELCRGLAGEFGEISVAIIKDAAVDLPPGVRRVRLARGNHLRKAAQLVDFVRRERFSLVHSHSVISNPYGWVLRSRAHGVKHLVHVHSHLGHLVADDQKSRLRRAVLLWSNLRALERCDRVIAVASSVRRHLVERGVDNGKIDVIHNGVDAMAIEASAREHCDVAAELDERRRRGPGSGDRSGHRPVVASVGRLSSIKDHRLLIDAAAALGHHERVLFAIVGDGPERARLEARARDAGVADSFWFVGWLANPYPLLSAADLVVLTSRSEGLPIAVLEAMALGKPVVATRVGGVAEVVEDGVSGELVDAGDAAALAAALGRMLADERRRHSFGSAGRNIVDARFSHTAMVCRVTDVYRALLCHAEEGRYGD